jgi:hypothetical protein
MAGIVARVSSSVLPAALATLASLAVAACSLGQGQGQVTGTLDVPDCWSGPFDLHPDFFAAVPATAPNGVQTTVNALQIRIQNGADFETFSDGLVIGIDDAGEVRGDPGPSGARTSLLGVPLVVSLPPSVVPPGVPITPIPNPRIVHAALYLGRTCRTQNDALYALDAVSTNPDGSCDRPPGGDPAPACGAPAMGPVDGGASDAGTDATAPDAGSSAPATTRQSTITFSHLFDGNPNESNAGERLSSATLDLYLGDPRETCPGGLGPPPRCRGHLTGWFNFYFQRGRPAQPFP